MHNYAVELYSSNGTTNLIETNLNWQNPVNLFSTRFRNLDLLGVTYDPINNSLWIGGWNLPFIIDYSLNGTRLSSFSTGLVDRVAALAFDPADGTLWFSDAENGQLYQYSTSGTLRQTGRPSGLPACCNFALSGEFAEPVPSVPEPATLFLLGTGLFGLGLMRWRKAA